MKYSPDQYILWQRGFAQINLTIVYTWVVMAILITMALVCRIKLNKQKRKKIPHLQNFFEIVIEFLERQMIKIGGKDMLVAVPFVATLFLFILFSNLISFIPGAISPTASLSTPVALALTVVLMDIFYRTKRGGITGWFKKYLRPSPIMLPLNIIINSAGAVSLAIRLYGNIMSGFVIGLVLLKVAFLAFGFPVFVQLITLITSVVQAYIFTVLAMVYIS